MDIRGNQPATWDDYDGVHRGSVDSTGSRVRWGEDLERRESGQSTATGADGQWPPGLRRRGYARAHNHPCQRL